MTAAHQLPFTPAMLFMVLLALTAFYGLLFSRNLIRMLICLELLSKATTALLAVAGYLTGRIALAQAYIITVIVIEVVVIAVAAGIIIGVRQLNQSLDARRLRNLQG